MTRFALLAGIAGPLISWGLGFIVIATWRGYDPIAQSISLLADAPMGWLQTAAFVVSGALGGIFAIGLGRVLGVTARDRTIVRGLLLFEAALAIGFAIFPTDLEGRGLTTVGRIHLALFYAYAITMPLTLLAIGRVMRRDPGWTALAGRTTLAGAVLIISTLLVPLTLDGPLTPWLGLLERIYVAIPSIWQVGVGIAGWRRLRSAAVSHRLPISGDRSGG